MKEKLQQLVELAKENKELLIKVGVGVAGALVGALVATVVANQADQAFWEEMQDQIDVE